MESLYNCTNEFQQQACAQRLDLNNTFHGYVESRREQVRIQEELEMKEKALRETPIRSMHEMGEMTRAHELRVDEFSVQKLRESHETILRLTSQLQEMQERVNYLNDTWRIPRSSVELWWKVVSRFPSTGKDSNSAVYAEMRQTIAT